MKLNRLLNWIAVAALGTRAAAFTYETPGELHLAADLDGDGREDVVIVDRETGAFRVGYQLAAGVHTFAAARASGIEEASTASAGRLLNLGRDALVIGSPWGNRLNLLDAPNAAAVVVPTSVYPPGIGPEETLAIDVGGAANTGHADLVTISSKNGGTPGLRRTVQRWDGATASTIENLGLDSLFQGLNGVRVKNGGSNLLGVLERTGLDYTLRIGSMASGTNVPVASAAGFRSRYVFGKFAVGPLHHFLSYDGGGSNLVVRAVTEPVAGIFGFGAAANYSLGRSIGEVVVLESVSSNRLLVIYRGGAEAGVYTFNGITAPALVQTITAPAGKQLMGALPLSNGEVHLLTGAPGSGRSSQFLQYRQDGANYVLKTSGALPDPNPLGTPANVFLFTEEPFVSATPNLVKSLNAADWVTAVNLGGGNVSATAERMGTPAQGLTGPSARPLGTKPATANFGLVNQFASSISMATFLPAIGDESGDVSISPAPGPQLRATVVTITPSVPATQVLYRTGPTATWVASFGATSFTLFQNTTVEFYSNPAGLPHSRIHRASYTFPDPPAEQDSDGDGVPDFVELAKGLNPNGGNDSDGDGFTDKNELFAGTDPKSTNDVPAIRIDEQTSFDLVVTPRGWDGVGNAEVALRLDQDISLRDLPGALLGRRRTVPLISALGTPGVGFRDAPANVGLALLSLSTESHFELNSAGVDRNVGRELLSLLPIPAVERAAYVYTPAAGDLLGQADAWIVGAKAALESLTTPRVATRFGVSETLGALLMERKVHQIFLSRGKAGLGESNAITLFPHRTGDILRTALTAGEVESLMDFGPGGLPAWNLTAMHRQVSNALPNGANLQLRRLATDLYRISSLSNNAAPGRYPLPVDALRQFIVTGVLHSNYVAATVLTPAERVAAKAASDALLNAIAPRPVTTLDVVVTPSTFDGDCTVVETLVGSQSRNLFTAPGVPFKFPDSFELGAGAVVRVRAFSDLDEACTGQDLQVIEANLLSVPPVPLVDVDGDLLPDAWECVFLAGNGDPSGDLDGDGISNLQEYLDGTDPGDNVYKALAVVNLSPPFIDISVSGGGLQKVAWTFPAAYAGRFEFELYAASDLLSWSDPRVDGFTRTGIPPTRLPGGAFEINLPVSDEGNRFFILVQRLR